jgi:CDP-paratose 2-epimerase
MKKAVTPRELRIADISDDARPVLITGGAGFIGTNLAHRLLSAGTPVTVFDNLSRPGVDRNLRWLRDTHGRLLRIELADVQDRAAVQRVVRSASRVIHLAAQVAVTTSLLDPHHDFEVNARGTLNLLSALNSLSDPPPLLFTSTNKVYGALDDVRLRSDGRRYIPEDEQTRLAGVDETRPLDFHSPYGCSKGAADQYVLDYARTFGLPAVVFRMSCIYGPHQFGTEDQGWVAHFLIRALRGETITLFGDGQQVRDVLFVDDLIDAMLLAFDNIEHVRGRAFNMGGGTPNTTSLLELVEQIGALSGTPPRVRFDDWRPGDQRYYVSDTARFAAMTGWRPAVDVPTGIRRLQEWLQESGVLALPPVAGTDTTWSLELASPAAAVAGER